MKNITLTLAAISTLSTAQAGTILTTDFSGVTTADVNLTGLTGYGFFSTNNQNVNSGLFGDGSTTNAGLFSTIANPNTTVITTVNGIDANLTEIRIALGAQTPVSDITFGGSQAFGAYGGFPGNAGDIWSLSFADLAAGDYTVTLYGGHSQGNRSFDVEAALTGASDDTEVSGAISGLGSTVGGGGFTTFRYDIDFTAAADDDLTLTFGSLSGSTGGAFLAGYTIDRADPVGVIPEPSVALLSGLGLLALLRRRR